MKKIIEEHGQRMESSIGLSIAMAVDTINKRVGQAEDALLHAAKVSSDAHKMNFDQLKEGQDSLERGQATLYETMNDRFDQLEKAIAENDEEAAKAKAVGDTVEYAASVKEEVEKIRAGQMSFFAEPTCTGLDGAGDGTVSGPRALVVVDFLGGFNASRSRPPSKELIRLMAESMKSSTLSPLPPPSPSAPSNGCDGITVKSVRVAMETWNKFEA